MIAQADFFEVLYPRREIGVSHYPMPSLPVADKSLKSLDFLNQRPKPNNGMLLYLHIPFCETFCSFCPYNKIKIDLAKVKKYLLSLTKELTWYSQTQYVAQSTIDAVYFGGGTPSLLTSNELRDLLQTIKAHFRLSAALEITVEGNASSFNEEKLTMLKNEGVNRISLGIQTFNDRIGIPLNLPHSSAQAIEIIQKIKKLHFPNLSIDLMYNLPGQSMDAWKKDIEQAVFLNIDHITLFHLVVVPTTALFRKVQNRELFVQDLHNELMMFHEGARNLILNGYQQQSTYDFGLPGKFHIYAVKHFVEKYDLLGLGMGSFGEINRKTYINSGNFAEYVDSVENNQLPIHLQNEVVADEDIHAQFSMGLRFLEVDFSGFKEEASRRFFKVFQRLLKKDLIVISNEKIALTQKGKLWGNNICKEFYSDEYKLSIPGWQRMEELAKK